MALSEAPFKTNFSVGHASTCTLQAGHTPHRLLFGMAHVSDAFYNANCYGGRGGGSLLTYINGNKHHRSSNVWLTFTQNEQKCFKVGEQK